MIRLKRRLHLWGGHLLLIPVVLSAMATLIFTREALRAIAAEVSWVYFVCAVASFLVLIAFGILSTVFLNTDRERYHLRAMWAADDRKAAGVPRTTEADGSPVSVAHSPDGEDSYA